MDDDERREEVDEVERVLPEYVGQAVLPECAHVVVDVVVVAAPAAH